MPPRGVLRQHRIGGDMVEGALASHCACRDGRLYPLDGKALSPHSIACVEIIPLFKSPLNSINREIKGIVLY